MFISQAEMLKNKSQFCTRKLLLFYKLNDLLIIWHKEIKEVWEGSQVHMWDKCLKPTALFIETVNTFHKTWK